MCSKRAEFFAPAVVAVVPSVDCTLRMLPSLLTFEYNIQCTLVPPLGT